MRIAMASKQRSRSVTEKSWIGRSGENEQRGTRSATDCRPCRRGSTGGAAGRGMARPRRAGREAGGSGGAGSGEVRRGQAAAAGGLVLGELASPEGEVNGGGQ